GGVSGEAGEKGGNMLCTRELARRQDPGRVSVYSLYPSMVDTRQAGGRQSPGAIGLAARVARPFSLAAAEGARAPVHLASSTSLEGRTGRHFVMGYPALASWAAS